ncbi:MAG: hypothetical protein JO316_20265 [Abitibacteriaceae bacterium]|nr:hypothetical protein [Abditibacteriaceae bacterium]
MAKFTVRVELHNTPLQEDYQRLNAAMECRGFKRTITAVAPSQKYLLPERTYSYTGRQENADDILRLVQCIVGAMGLSAAIVVTQVAVRRFSGLDEVP